MQKFKETLLPLSFMASILVLCKLYLILNAPENKVYNLVTDLDRSVPFLKVFILPYIGFYAFIAITLCYFCFKDRGVYYKTLVSLNIGMAICFVIYYSYQTKVPRPVLTGNGLLTSLLQYVYTVDKPFNCFPSSHCLASYLMIKGINKSIVKNRLNSFLITGMAILVILSTQFVKQHVILDAVAAVILAETVFRAVDKFKIERALVWKMPQEERDYGKSFL